MELLSGDELHIQNMKSFAFVRGLALKSIFSVLFFRHLTNLILLTDAIKYYSDAKNRGYLAHPEAIQEERFILAQKYGYELPEITDEVLKETKDPRQVFYGLEPGWLVNLADKEIYKPQDPELIDYYKS